MERAIEGWITIATHGLPDAARERLTAEIEDHYASLVDAQIKAGQAQEEAEQGAIRQLGDARLVSRNYLDAHFRRDRYRRGMWAVIAWSVVLLIGNVGNEISRWIDGRGEVNYVAEMLLAWNVVAMVATGVFMLMTAQMVVMLWRDCFEMRVSKYLRCGFVSSIAVGTAASALQSAMYWFTWYVTGSSGLADMTLWRQVFATLSTVWQVANIVGGGCWIVFVVMAWNTMHREAVSVARALLIMIGLEGVAVIGMSVVAMGLIPINGYYLERYYVRLVVPAVLWLMAVMLVTLIGVFRSMSLSGRTLRRIEQ